MIIPFSAETEERLFCMAQACGQDVQTLVLKIIEESFGNCTLGRIEYIPGSELFDRLASW